MSKVSKIASLSLALMVFAGVAQARPAVEQPIRGWSAMGEQDAAALLETVQDLPLADQAASDHPYCAGHDEIAQTLQHDFGEALVEISQFAGIGAQLWGSDQLGTWTLVAPRADGTSCIIASGIGFDPQRDSQAYFNIAGLR